MENRTDLCMRRDGYIIKGTNYVVSEMIVYDESGKETCFDFNCYGHNFLHFNVKIKRKLKKDISKRETFVLRHAGSTRRESTYYLYVPSEYFDFKVIKHIEHETNFGLLESYDQCSFKVEDYECRILSRSTLIESDEFKSWKKLSEEFMACTCGLTIYPTHIRDILKKYDIIPKKQQ